MEGRSFIFLFSRSTAAVMQSSSKSCFVGLLADPSSATPLFHLAMPPPILAGCVTVTLITSPPAPWLSHCEQKLNRQLLQPTNCKRWCPAPSLHSKKRLQQLIKRVFLKPAFRNRDFLVSGGVLVAGWFSPTNFCCRGSVKPFW